MDHPPATYEATAMNGHLLIYPVIGIYPDGAPRTSQWDAQHSPNCRCHTTEEAEPLPDW